MSDLRIYMISNTSKLQANISLIWIGKGWNLETQVKKSPEYQLDRLYSQYSHLRRYQHLSGQHHLGELIIQGWTNHFYVNFATK